MKKKPSRAKNNATKTFKNKMAANIAINKADRAYSAAVAVTYNENGKPIRRSEEDIKAAREHLRAVQDNARGLFEMVWSTNYYDCLED